MRSSFVLYTSWGPMVREMSAEQAGELMKACYALEMGEEYEISDSAVRIIFASIKATMIDDRERYEEKCRTTAENVQKRPLTIDNDRKRPLTTDNERERSGGDYESEYDSDNEYESDKEIKKKPSRAAFVKPTLEEIKAYCKERKNNVDPEAFMDFYASKGWKVGSQPMKDWKAAVRTWEKREKPKEKPPDQQWSQRTYDYDALEKQLLGWGN